MTLSISAALWLFDFSIFSVFNSGCLSPPATAPYYCLALTFFSIVDFNFGWHALHLDLLLCLCGLLVLAWYSHKAPLISTLIAHARRAFSLSPSLKPPIPLIPLRLAPINWPHTLQLKFHQTPCLISIVEETLLVVSYLTYMYVLSNFSFQLFV